jgi:hypothetical protein
MSLKNASRSLFHLCLIGFCLLAASSVACAQSTDNYYKYQVMGVVYAPPRSASNVTYGQSKMVGSTNTYSNTTGNTTDSFVEVSADFGTKWVGGGFTVKSDNTTGSSEENINSVQVQTTNGNSISTMGPISSSLGVDHDNDVIYIWLNPVVTANVSATAQGTPVLNWTGLWSNSCDPIVGPPSAFQGYNGCDPNQYPYPDIVGIPVWCLKNPYFPNPSCSQWLPYTSRSWDQSIWGNDPNTGLPLGPGLTMRDYADILQADPFVALNGNAVNVCHPSYGPSLDPNLTETLPSAPRNPLNPTQLALLPNSNVAGGWINFADPIDPNYANTSCTPVLPASSNTTCPSGFLPSSCTSANNTTGTMNRFVPYGTVEYPVPGPNGLPSTYSGQFQNSNTYSTTNVATDTHTASESVSVTFHVGSPLNHVSLTAGYSNTSTTQQQTSIGKSVDDTGYANYSITGPQLSDNYIGPATYNVYQDSVYGTYAFYSDLEPPVTPVELGNIGISISNPNNISGASINAQTAR